MRYAHVMPTILPIVAGINLDMIGRDAGDSIRIGGLSDFEFAVRPDWIAAARPELRLTVVDGGTISSPQSDHVAFVRQAMPMLYFSNGSHEGRSEARAAPAVLDAEQQARILRLVYYISHEFANTDPVPRWTATARQQRSRTFGQ